MKQQKKEKITNHHTEPSPGRGVSPLALPQQKKQRTPLGKPIEWTDEDLDALSTISPADLKAADALWQRDAPKPLKSLLHAQVVETDTERK